MDKVRNRELTEEIRRRVVALRRQQLDGRPLSYRVISERTGLHPATCHSIVKNERRKSA